MSSSVILSISSACSSKGRALVGGLVLCLLPLALAGQETDASPTFSRSVLLPAASVNLSAPAPGIIRSQPVPEGARVSAGEVILELDSREDQARVKEAEAQLDLAGAEVARTESAFRRAKELFESNFQSQRQYEEVTALYERAQAMRKQAEAGLDGARIKLERKSVRAPFDGLLLRRFKFPGEAVENFETVARIIDDRSLVMLLFADASQFGSVKLGESLPIELLDGPKRGTRLQAEVISVDPVIDPASGTFRFKLRLLPEENVTVGLSARLLPRSEPKK